MPAGVALDAAAANSKFSEHYSASGHDFQSSCRVHAAGQRVVDFGKRKSKAMAAKKSKSKKSSKPKARARKPSKMKKTIAKVAAKLKAAKNKKKATPKPSRQRSQSVRAVPGELVQYEQRERRASSGGQSGDMQGIAAMADVDSESVEQLLEEGQTFEAEAVSGVENAPDPDQAEVHTREVPEDDVPEEYLEKD